ncbi:hypothetical protein COO60DRAFT_197555 [Scenedesmus sp. NREL 46B-D3]|nr:hypothetical protein COO60DRAFT_197555 [Scenedesmus sp. NREL 46B-D3]
MQAPLLAVAAMTGQLMLFQASCLLICMSSLASCWSFATCVCMQGCCWVADMSGLLRGARQTMQQQIATAGLSSSAGQA